MTLLTKMVMEWSADVKAASKLRSRNMYVWSTFKNLWTDKSFSTSRSPR